MIGRGPEMGMRGVYFNAHTDADGGGANSEEESKNVELCQSHEGAFFILDIYKSKKNSKQIAVIHVKKETAFKARSAMAGSVSHEMLLFQNTAIEQGCSTIVLNLYNIGAVNVSSPTISEDLDKLVKITQNEDVEVVICRIKESGSNIVSDAMWSILITTITSLARARKASLKQWTDVRTYGDLAKKLEVVLG